MKKLLPLFLTLAALVAPHSSHQKPQGIDELSWLLGQWQRLNAPPGTTAFEFWEKQTDTEYKGIGFTLKDTDTVFVEHLQLLQEDNALFYIAKVAENDNPVRFRLTYTNADGFTCENPEHDFPKVISYKLEHNKLIASISDGASRKKDFVFNKLN